MFEFVAGSLKRFSTRFGRFETIQGFSNVKIINRLADPVWLAKDSVGNLHEILNPGKSLEVRFPSGSEIKFFAYRAANNLAPTGLEYLEEKEFSQDDFWEIS